jgi:CHAT domain-containing protein
MAQRLADLKLAVSFSDQVYEPNWDPGLFVFDLARTELMDQRRAAAAHRMEAFVLSVPPRLRGHLITAGYFLTWAYAINGDVGRAERALSAATTVWRESFQWTNLRTEWVATWDAQMQISAGRVFELKGQSAPAIAAYRRAAEVMRRNPSAAAEHDLSEVAMMLLATALAREGALLEAEVEARRALASVLRKRGSNFSVAIAQTNFLASILLEQGRSGEAEALARAANEAALKTGMKNFFIRRALVSILVTQARWDEALRELDALLLAGQFEDPAAKRRFFGAPDMILPLLVRDRAVEVIDLLQPIVAEERQRIGALHPQTAVHRALLALANAAAGGNREIALRELREVMPALVDRRLDIDDESTTRPAADRRREFILTRYIGLLADVVAAGGPGAGDAINEAFRLAEAIRGRSVDRALDASSARNATSVPGLADLVRRSQDAKKQIDVLYASTVNILSARPEDQDAGQLRSLRLQVETLQGARQTIDREIAREYPAYAQLVNSEPGTVTSARQALRAGEALISTLVTEDRTYIWAIPRDGPVAFAAVPLGASAVRATVAHLRRALDPGISTLGDIPPFDTDAAHALYLTLLEPVKGGWNTADTLLVIPHDALGYLPFALLPTEMHRPSGDDGALFSRYRSVPWLVRTHAITVLPSAGALTTLRSMAAAPPGRRPFIGFGDPYFTREQARRRRERSAASEDASALELRQLKRDSAASGRLVDLPALPDTAQEIEAIASMLGADRTRDIFLGERANDSAVRAAQLARYRVVAFATHGLLPGDLVGLTQPALALTAPEIAGIEGDGLLTMEKILGLRLNADWVVLSACNTASGGGAGAEAISGLGRAFFYAGTRALLVTNWPVETTSARLLTTELFRRQEAKAGLTRAHALQQAMLTLMDGPGFVDPRGRVVFSYAHPIFWAPFILVGDGG